MRRIHLFLICLLCSGITQAAVIIGHVHDGSGAPVAGLVVHARDTSCGAVWDLSDTTDATGLYSMTIPSSVCIESWWYISGTECAETITTVHYYTGSTIEANITVCPDSPGSGTSTGCDTVWGHAYLGPTDGIPAYPAMVYLIQKTYNPVTESYWLEIVDSTTTYPSGEYIFYCVPSPIGDMMVKAVLDVSSSSYWDYLPTYHFSSLTWNLADPLTIGGTGNDIHMQEGVNPGGPGFISGDVLVGAGKGTSVGDPIGSSIMYLTTDTDVPVAFTFTDDLGNFSFTGLAYGTYKLFGDAQGKDNPPMTVTINAATPGVENILFEAHNVWFGGHVTTAIGNVSGALSQIVAGPNPAKDVVTISGMGNIQGEKNITVRNVTGQVVSTTTLMGATQNISVSSLPAGVYLFQVMTNEGTVSFKIVK